MKILIHHHKYGDAYYRADTEENERWAFHAMFKALDEFEAYVGIDDEEQASLYRKAKAGDHAAARRLAKIRRDYEYEGFELALVAQPSAQVDS